VNSIILASTSRLIAPLLLAASIFALLRGHNEPGGGFVGGLLAASGLALRTLAGSRGPSARRLQATIGSGLALAIASGSVSFAMGQPFLTNVSFGVVSTVLLFDIGVFLIVVGMALLMLAAVAKEAP
jgi:multicomponent Na+:H+ antiporter subunit B